MGTNDPIVFNLLYQIQLNGFVIIKLTKEIKIEFSLFLKKIL
jgi:hypothetical protein